MRRHRAFRIFSLLLITAAALAAAFFLWQRGIFLTHCSPWSRWTPEKEAEASSGDRIFRILLKNRRISVYSAPPESPTSGAGFEKTWESPSRLQVQDFLFCDIDRDGALELLLLCWYAGDPVSWDSGQPVIAGKQWTQHIYIYKAMDDGSMHEQWMASRIMQNIASWAFDEEFRLFFTDSAGDVTRWDWFGWGLKYYADGYPEARFLVSGDNLIHRMILEQGQRENSFDFLYEHIAPELEKADIAVLGQEGMFVEPRTGYSGYPLFRTPVYVGEAALKAGFNAAACATNHALDAGAAGINTTAAFYEERGIPCLGILPEWKKAAGEPPYHLFTQNGIRIAVFDYTYGTNAGDPEAYWPGAVHVLKDENAVRNEIASAVPAADAVIVLVHWGTEYSPEPDEEQRRWAKVFLEAGADLVAGSHPHVLQPLGVLTGADGKQMPVFWSLGNLVSRQDQPDRVLGGLAEFTVRRTPGDTEITDCRLVPVITHQTEDTTSVWLLSDYTESMAAEHRLDVRVLLNCGTFFSVPHIPFSVRAGAPGAGSPGHTVRGAEWHRPDPKGGSDPLSGRGLRSASRKRSAVPGAPSVRDR